MGQPVDTGNNDLQSKANASGKGVVDNKKANEQGLSSSARRPVRGLDWTFILERAGLESPGYRETIDKMKADGKLK
jgi:hypothetical protein